VVKRYLIAGSYVMGGKISRFGTVKLLHVSVPRCDDGLGD